MINIVYLDADFIIKTSKIKNNSSTLFDKIMELPYSFRITNIVFNEIKNSSLKKQLVDLIIKGKIKLIKSSECISALKDFLSDSAIQSLVLSTLEDICENIQEDQSFYQSNFYKLEALSIMQDDVDHFIDEFELIVTNISKDNNIGEIVTLLNISLCNRLENVKVISLLSHDSSARRCVLSLHENINSFDCYSCHYLLKSNNILSFDEAKKYVSSWLREFPRNNIVKIIEEKSPKGVDLRKFIDIVYNSSNYTILRNGILKK